MRCILKRILYLQFKRRWNLSKTFFKITLLSVFQRSGIRVFVFNKLYIMKIELKHVAPYLPYGLKNVKAFHTPKEITGIIGSQVFFGDSSLFLIQIQPLLNPLSDVYIGTGGELMAKYNCSLNVIHEMWKLIQGDIELEDVSYRTYLMMCRNHIDFNRLIEAGLAIDKNTLNK